MKQIKLYSILHIQIWRRNFLLKNIKVIQWLSNSKVLTFVTELNPNNGNETKSDILP